ncbi:MAG: hypothetical protein II399_05885 [Lachnospiraceae bacterium]|nr:hypothetical protein [Lachnospiraceae bacterium]
MDILFSKDSAKKTIILSKETIKDLAISDVVEEACVIKEDIPVVEKVLSAMPTEATDMRFRGEILKDLYDNKELCDKLSESVHAINKLKNYSGNYKVSRQSEINLYTLLEDLRELSVYSTVTEELSAILHEFEVKSTGLISLREELDATINSKEFAELKTDIEQMINDLSSVKGALIGVNFTPDLDVEEVAAIDFVPYKLVSKYSLIEKLNAMRMITPTDSSTKNARVPDPLLVTIAPKIQKHLKKHYSDIKKKLTQYSDFDTRPITEMHEGLIFYLVMAKYARYLANKGYDICFPEIKEDERMSVKGLYNIRLAIEGAKDIVKNDFSFSRDERIFILTGPNRGGKTIIEQAIGLASFMAAHGLFVMASSFTGLPFANILTHFPIDENLTINYGRLGEEAVRIKEIVKNSDDNTLILFNETFSTTSAYDGVYLSKDLIRVLKEKGTYAIFNTHLHELASDIPEMNKWDDEGDIISIVMERKDDKNTFLLKRAEPDNCSYAHTIAEKYGITYEQMTEKNE